MNNNDKKNVFEPNMGPRTREVLKRTNEVGAKAVSAYDFSAVCDYFNNPDNFKSFGETVMEFLKLHHEVSDNEKALNLLIELGQEKSISKQELVGVTEEDTWNNWFSGSIPKERSKGFAIAFALSLSVDETKEFIRKAFFDREFDPKDYCETVYYYCLANLDKGYNWQKAKEIIKQIANNCNKKHEQLPYTMGALSRDLNAKNSYDALSSMTEEELLKRCEMIANIDESNHDINLKRTAKTWIKLAREESKKENGEIEYILKRIPYYADSDIEPHELYDSSVGTLETDGDEDEEKGYTKLINTIVGYRLVRRESKGDKYISNRQNLSLMKKMIITNFPDERILSKIENDKCEKKDRQRVRNTIILLSSYCYWRNNKLSLDSINYEDIGDCYKNYVDFVNEELDSALVSRLYPCNPFDGMFLLSSMQFEYGALDNFRLLMEKSYSLNMIIGNIDKAINNEEENAEEFNETNEINTDLSNIQEDYLKSIYRTSGAERDKNISLLTDSLMKDSQKDNGHSLWDAFIRKFAYLKKDKYYKLRYLNRFYAIVKDDPCEEDDEDLLNGDVATESELLELDGNKAFDDEQGVDYFERNGFNTDSSEIAEIIGKNVCIEAINLYDKRKGKDLKKWVMNRWYYILGNENRWDQYYQIFEEKYIPEDVVNLYKPFYDCIDDEIDKCIIKYRFGFEGEQVYYLYNKLREVVKNEVGISVDCDDVVLAEKRFFRLIKYTLLFKNKG